MKLIINNKFLNNLTNKYNKSKKMKQNFKKKI